MNDPVARPPLGGAVLSSAHDTGTRSGSRALAQVVGVLEELQELASEFDARRIAWGALRLLPAFTLPRSRARVMALMGSQIGLGTAFTGHVHLVGPPGCASKLRVGTGCIIGPDVTLGLNAPIALGDNVSIGPRAVLYTATHPLGVASRRMQLTMLARPIVVEDGAWVGFAATLLPGVRVGRGAVVSAGAVVNEDVPANALVAGNPAKVIQMLSDR